MRRACFLIVVSGLALSACDSSATSRSATTSASRLAHWSVFIHVQRPLDLAAGRRDGSILLAANGRLRLLLGSGRTEPFAPGYKSPGGGEPYIAIPARRRTGCRFGARAYALKLPAPHGVSSIGKGGLVAPLATLGAGGLENGIAFDRTGRFGHRLLVTLATGSRTTVDAIDCHGAVTTITRAAPRIEGGIAVAPASFGRFAGDLIAPDELSGRIFAITPGGKSMLVTRSGLAHGQDVGVESEAFIPAGRYAAVLLADRLTPGNRHPGDDVVLRLSRAALGGAGVRPGDLLVATEGGAVTEAISCAGLSCQARHVADGPTIAHAEGHIVVLAG